MKTVEAGQFAANVEQYLRDSQLEVIVVAQAGKPCAVVHGLGYDDEQLQLINSPEFWSLIKQRRNGETLSWEAAKERLRSLDR